MSTKPAKVKRRRINPDQGLPWVKKPAEDVPMVIPLGLKVQREKAYTHDPRYQVGPDERPAGAGFVAEWDRLRA